jgi:hypothetical protein
MPKTRKRNDFLRHARTHTTQDDARAHTSDERRKRRKRSKRRKRYSIMGAGASAMPKPIEAIFHGEPLLAAGGADAFDTFFTKDAKVEFLGQWAPKTADGKAVIITSKELKEVFDCLIKGFSDFTVRRRRRRRRGFDAIIRSIDRSIIQSVNRRVSTFWLEIFSLFSRSISFTVYTYDTWKTRTHFFIFLRFVL